MKIYNFIKNTLPALKTLPNLVVKTTTFFLLLCTILLSKVFLVIAKNSRTPEQIKIHSERIGSKIYLTGVHLLDKNHPNSIGRSNLIEMSLKNMQAKKTRTLVTIGGMTIGIAAIVFLVSIGYGLQELVISRIARLDELKQADLSPQPGSKVKINDKTIADLNQIKNVEKIMPLISVVGHVSYKNSDSDMAVYGVTADYLIESAIKPSAGKVFTNNDLKTTFNEPEKNRGPQVAGVSTANQNILSDENSQVPVEFDVTPNSWAKVRSNASADSQLLGFTKHIGSKVSAVEVLGATYLSSDTSGKFLRGDNNQWFGKWIKATVPLYKQANCNKKTSPECIDEHYLPVKDSSGSQELSLGYIAEVNLQVVPSIIVNQNGQVLGLNSEESSNSSVLAASLIPDLLSNEIDISQLLNLPNATDSAISKLASQSATAAVKTRTASLGPKSQRVAVVNQAALKVLGMSQSKAIGQKFQASFTVVGSLLDNPDEKLVSNPTDYTIIAVIPDDKTPLFFVPFIDLRSLGVTNYSQLKLVATNKEDLPLIRKKTEALGLSSHSVADTVDQINTLFSSIRTIMALLGMVALAVASLGMFNTLTVSLLERTREVGLMKAMGMRSVEIKELFLTESLVMSVFGGIFGLIVGAAAGKALGLILSIFTFTKGLGIIDISYVPITLSLTIIVLSFIVGIFTGYYPSRRATKISALDALRYE